MLRCKQLAECVPFVGEVQQVGTLSPQHPSGCRGAERYGGSRRGHRRPDRGDLSIQPDAAESMLLDVTLPGMSGLRGLRTVKHIQSRTSFIIITEKEDEADLAE